MEVVSGGEMFTHLRRARKFSDEQSKFYGLIVAAIFAHMHASNIVHRTLSFFAKPDSVS